PLIIRSSSSGSPSSAWRSASSNTSGAARSSSSSAAIWSIARSSESSKPVMSSSGEFSRVAMGSRHQNGGPVGEDLIDLLVTQSFGAPLFAPEVEHDRVVVAGADGGDERG